MKSNQETPGLSVTDVGLRNQIESELGHSARMLDSLESGETLFNTHRELVRHMAISFAQHGADLEQLVQEGNLALIRAEQTYERGFDVSFATYAAYWIRSYMQRHLASLRSRLKLTLRRVTNLGDPDRRGADRRRFPRKDSPYAAISAGADAQAGDAQVQPGSKQKIT